MKLGANVPNGFFYRTVTDLAVLDFARAAVNCILPWGVSIIIHLVVEAGDGSRVMSELNRLAYPKRVSPAQRTISCVDFATDTIEVRKARLEDEAKAEAADRERAAAARRKHLESVMKDADEIWVRRDELVDEKTAFAYDDAAKQFKDLCDAYRQAERDAEFQDRLTIFRKNYARRPAMMRRIKNL